MGTVLSCPVGASDADAKRFGPMPGLLLQDVSPEGAWADTTRTGDAPIERRPEPEQVIVKLKAKKPGYFDAPGWVMLRSAIVPGWGQIHNRSWIKGVAIAGVEVWVALRLVDDQKKIDDLALQVEAARAAGNTELEDLAIEQHNARLDTFVARQWLMGGVIAYALLDAYIDAHFRDFDVGFRGDSALPGGKPDAAGGGSQLFLRWRF